MTRDLYMSGMTKPNELPAAPDSPSTPTAPAASTARQLNGWLATMTVVYLLSLYLVQGHTDWSPAWRVAVTLAPILPGVGYFRSVLRSFRELDELQRRIRLEAWSFALTGTLAVSTALNVLNANGIGFDGYPHGLEMGGVYLTMFLFWSVGVAFATKRYQ